MDNIKTNGTSTLETQKIPKFTHKIGGTTYEVHVHFSKTSNESINDKILRLTQSNCRNLGKI